MRGKLLTGEAGAVGHGRFRSGRWIVLRLWLRALSTKVLIFENERIVEKIAFIFGTGVTGCDWDDLRVFRRKGGSPSTTATIMVGVLRVLIPTVVHIDTCTAEGVLLEF